MSGRYSQGWSHQRGRTESFASACGAYGLTLAAGVVYMALAWVFTHMVGVR